MIFEDEEEESQKCAVERTLLKKNPEFYKKDGLDDTRGK